MTGGLFAPPLLLSPSLVHQVASSYLVDSFSEFSTRTVYRASCSPSSAASGSRSARGKEEDEELFRDLFGNDAETDGAPALAATTFLPQKPATTCRRTLSSCGGTNPRQHLAPMKPVPPQPAFIPRLKLEDLVNDDVEYDNNNDSRRISRRGSELEQVTEEDESCFDDDRNTAPRKPQTLNYGQGSLRFPANNQISSNNAQLEQETLQFLEKLDLKAVLQTPRPDILTFYPGVALSPTSRSMASPQAKVFGVPVNQEEDYFVEKPEKDRTRVVKGKSDTVYKETTCMKDSRDDSVASRLAYMESTYGTAPIARKTRRGTIDRLANPISGHSSTLQALSPKLREKREAALTSRVLISPISAAIAVSSRRGTTTKKAKKSLLGGLSKRVGDCEIPMPSTTILKRQVVKRQDPLVHKRRSKLTANAQVDSHASAISGLTRRKSKTSLGCGSLGVRKEALKNKLQSQWGTTKRDGNRQIGGSTFLTQHDDDEGIELVEDFIARHRGAAQASLTFRSGKKAPSRQPIPALSTRNSATTRSQPRPPQTREGVPFARASGASKNSSSGRGARTSRGLESWGNLTDRKVDRLKLPENSTSSGPTKLFQQPRRPQAWQTAPTTGHHLTGARTLIERPTTPGGVSNPLRRLKVHPPMPTVVPRAPKPPVSAATTLLIGSTSPFSFSGATADGVKRARCGSKKLSARKPTGSLSSGTFNAPTKVSEQRKRTSTTARRSGGEKAVMPRQTFTVRRSTSRI
ncbi:hypothetical protein V7S43_012332 [Phytophthora oleae]|uniref:TPX2 central domain-containing protein n=1 Tax=Phytophthora oleae TaxID=2107226 RepID=A0ABD3F6K8_9STRA